MRTQLRLILSTLALTALIWTYADRTGHGTIPILVPVTVTPAKADSPLLFSFPDAPEGDPKANVTQVKMTFRGPNRAIALLKSEHEYGGFGLTVKIDEDLPNGLTSKSVLLLPLLRDDSEILKRGLTLEKVSPETINFNVDRYRTIPVKLNPVAGSFEDQLAERIELTPKEVDARVREGKLREGFSLSSLSVALEEGIKEELERQGDETDPPPPLEFDVALESPPDLDATFEPEEVHATVRLKALTESVWVTVRPLGTNIKTEDFFKEGYEIRWKEPTDARYTVRTRVRVPVKDLKTFQQLDPSSIDAYVVIDDNDLLDGPAGTATTTSPASDGGTYRSKEVRFRFPPPFEALKLDGPPPWRELRVVKKEASPAVHEEPSPP